ncbi:hypothetical protein C2S51_037183 [Perilla frutescens var. frutescens]|nr:hypothetical protein C2S51_037183 [Perilla frutescens var. frutescens]
MQGTLPTNLTLRDRYNNLWQVSMEVVGGNWYFKDGWTEFAEDNMIEGGDMLVYEYSSRGLLDFKVHGRSNCSTKGVGGDMNCCEGEQVIDDVTHSIPTTEEFDFLEEETTDVDDSDDDDYSPTTEEDKDHDDYPEVDKEMDEENQQEVDPNGNGAMNVDDHDINCKREPTTEDVNKERTQEEGRRDDSIPGVQVRDDGGASTSKRKSRRAFDWYGVEIFQSGLVHQPNNPYFVTKKRKQRACELYMPMDVIKSYGLQLPDTIVLIDPRRREFRATRKMWSDGRTVYSGGWKSLCGMNQVKDEDTCICEFIPRGQDLCIHVSFFPPKH